MNSCVLYIDPGTGAMLLTTILGLVTTIGFVGKKIFFKVKFWLSGGKDKTYKQMDVKIPIVIFSDNKRYWYEFKGVCDELERRAIPCCYWTISEDDPALKESYKYVKCSYIESDNRAYVRLNSMNAYVCLSTTPGLDVYQWKRSKNTDWYVHVIHGIGDAAGYRMFGLEGFDAVLVAGEHHSEQIRKLEMVRHRNPKEIVIVGESYMDTLKKRYNERNDEHYDVKQRVVLLAPSWGKSSLLVKYGEKIIDSLLKTGYEIIIRPHPQSFSADKEIMDRLMTKYNDSNTLVWDRSIDNFDSLNKADIMISDFSSVIWDYTFIFDKPVIYADVSFDSAPYDLAWLEEDRWDFRALSLMGVNLKEEDFPRIKLLIDKAIDSDELRQERAKLREQAWKCQGEAAIRITDYVTDKYMEFSEKNIEET